MSVQVNNISKSFGELKALDSLSFEVEENEIFGLIGPDGAGKTTLFRILATLLLADAGEAEMLGMDVRKDYRKIRQVIGYMPGRFSLYQDLSVKENLEFYATVFGTTIEDNYDLIKDIYSHIEPFEKRLAGRLSGGMKQKLALSCALIHRPKVLILDEPTTGVDAVSRKEFWDMLRRIKDEGITILVATPYMDEAALCNHIALIQKGRLLSVEDPMNLSVDPNQVVLNFRTSEGIYIYLERIRSVYSGLKAYLFGDEIHIYVERTRVEMLKKEINSWDVSNLYLEEVNPEVEDLFMQLMVEENS